MTEERPDEKLADRTGNRPVSELLDGRGIRWFASEFAVVVAGVLVALAFQAAWSWRQDRRTESVLLSEMLKDLEQDSIRLTNSARSDEAFLKAVDSVAARIDRREAFDGYGVRFRDLGMIHTLSLQTAQYQTLKSRGLALIGNDSLRGMITRFYEVTGPELEKQNAWQRTAESRWMPPRRQSPSVIRNQRFRYVWKKAGELY